MSRESKREILEGVVRSAKAPKTITVAVPRVFKHAKYEKVLRRESVFYAHDEKGEAKEGDRVAICATRPLSRTKHWRLVRILKRAETV